MTTIKTSELIGAALDWAVGEIEFSRLIAQGSHVKQWVLEDHRAGRRTVPWSTDWQFGGPLIEREGITPYEDPNWFEGRFATPRYLASKALRVVEGTYYSTQTGADPDQIGGDFTQSGDTYLIAAMRCYVASKLGGTVDVPDNLE